MDGKSCTMCWNYKNGFCKQWKQRLSDITAAESCDKFSIEKKLNKGMQIRQNKLTRQAKKRAEVKEEQKDLVRFVEFNEQIIERINGKYRHPTRAESGRGLQIKNRIYLESGSYKMVNRSTLKITRVYENVPEWAESHLRELYVRAQQQVVASSSSNKLCSGCIFYQENVNPVSGKRRHGWCKQFRTTISTTTNARYCKEFRVESIERRRS